ncbi:hypothetical protein OGAPHI_005912 [Ogataea philodendri]|uniref:Exportin-5 C-terminal domain-containing protein n=2 Tax=Saccharomycotina TaxID=147537 RepID=A0A9P8NYE3_9ASCO|nr:uncharacterized protein OGAPHI_005912 [Ogataea philodendri]KAH3661734.1 hypothetical protein OGAPHI_005912 [Ogataea philodendri]
MDQNGVDQIVGSLQIIYNPQSTNEDRHKAQEFLETIKKIPESPFWGYLLALPDSKHDFIVRHFGLNLLSNAIVKDFSAWDLEKQVAVRNWVIELATKVSPQDPHYMKEKVAFLWVETAKRCWGLCLSKEEEEIALKDKSYSEQERLESWASMDSNLLDLWNHSLISRELSLIIFRALFEDVYLLDDPVVSQRNNVLSSLCPEVVTSEQVLLLKYEPNESLRIFAASSEGWLNKWSTFLEECIDYMLNHPQSTTDETYKSFYNFAVKILQVFKTSLYWILPIAFRSAGVLEKLSRLLRIDDVQIKTLTVDCLQVLFTRSYSEEADFKEVLGSIFQTEGLAMLFKVFEEIRLDPDDVDESEYTLLKKLVEMIVGLSEYFQLSDGNSKFKLPENADVLNYFKLVLETTKHQSLVISGLSLQFWCSMLRIDELSDKSDFEQIMPDLLETTASRLINYSDYDEDCVEKKMLEIDFESQSEATTFLSNYKKLSDDIVRIIICKKPNDGLQWLANRLNKFYSSPVGSQALNDSKLVYKGKNSEPFVYGYAQFVTIEACVRGISRWLIWCQDEDMESKKEYLIGQVDELCKMLLSMTVKDPMLLRKQIQTLVQFTPLLKDASGTMFKVLEKVMESCTFDYPVDATDDERELIRDLRTSGGTELNRLAYLMPESLKDILSELEAAIASILSSKKLSDHEAVAFKSFLLVVSQRSSIDNKAQRFANIVDPELVAWSNTATEKGLLELHWFMERLGIVRIADYFQSRGITASTDLLQAEMDERGRELKIELKDHWSSVFPIRATRIFIQYSIEKLDHQSDTYQDLLKLWKPRIKPILPHILQLIYQIQAYHNPANWEGLPTEVQSFVKHSCMERFWQQGVSIQSKESFMDESVKAMHTLRDFADSVGHIVRYTREYAYLTISSISELEETLYEIPDCANLLWKALTGEPVGITLHSWRHMLNLVIRSVIKNCPISHLSSFMVELLPQVLNTIDALLISKWDAVFRKGLQLEGNESDEQLSEEMMEEHMLRQLTAVVDRMLIDLVGQQAPASLNQRQLKTREIIFGDLNLLAPLLNLLCHIINFKDTRCSFNAILIVKHMAQDLISLNNDAVDKYLSEHVIETLLGVLVDKFYVDAHPEAAYTLTILYMGLRYKSSYPAMILQKCLDISNKDMNQFEMVLMNCKKLRERRNCLLQLVENSSNNGDSDEQKMKDRKKQVESAQQRRSKKGSGEDVMDDPLTEKTLNNMFGDDME